MSFYFHNKFPRRIVGISIAITTWTQQFGIKVLFHDLIFKTCSINQWRTEKKTACNMFIDVMPSKQVTFVHNILGHTHTT